MDDWSELEELVNDLEQRYEERWRQLAELRQQMAALQSHLEIIRRQFDELEVDAHLQALNQKLLGGLGSVEMIHSGAGIEYIAALVWPAHIVPQDIQDASEDGVYRIEVWLGPSLEDGRPRIRISGSKRLEALLPTSSNRFRSALLTVFQSPMFIVRPESDISEQEVGAAEPSGSEAAESSEPEAAEPSEPEQQDAHAGDENMPGQPESGA